MSTVTWGLFRQRGQTLQWAGEIEWVGDTTGRGWILAEQPDYFCPCKCEIFDFDLERSRHVRTWEEIYGKKPPLVRPVHGRVIRPTEFAHEGSSYFWHRGKLGRMDFKTAYDEFNFVIDELRHIEPEDSGNLIKQKILIFPVPAGTEVRLAVLTHIGNVGATKIVFKNRGHTALVVGGTVHSFEAMGWYHYTPVETYWTTVREHQEINVAVQEIDPYRGHWKLGKGIRDEVLRKPPWYAYLPLPFASPFLIPGGVCSQASASLLGIDPPGDITSFFMDTPQGVFYEVRRRLRVLREYFISWKMHWIRPDESYQGKPRNYWMLREQKAVQKWLGTYLPVEPRDSIVTWR